MKKKQQKRNQRKNRWSEFYRWEKKYEIEHYKTLTPTEKIRILEDLYLFAMKLKEELE